MQTYLEDMNPFVLKSILFFQGNNIVSSTDHLLFDKENNLAVLNKPI